MGTNNQDTCKIFTSFTELPFFSIIIMITGTSKLKEAGEKMPEEKKTGFIACLVLRKNKIQ